MEKEIEYHLDGPLTRAVERQTTKIPSLGYLGLAMGSMAVAVGLELFTKRRRDPANFVGLWVPTLLLFGVYNKLVKLEESLQQPRPGPGEYTH